jgi:hypothetical protein
MIEKDKEKNGWLQKGTKRETKRKIEKNGQT